MKDFGKATGGTSIESEFCENGKYKVISIGSYSENSKYTDQGIRVNKTSKTESRILNKNDLTMILNDKTSSGNIIGRVLLINADDTYVYNQRTERIEVYKNDFEPAFIYQLLNANNIRKKIIQASQGNTQIYVNWTAICEIIYKVPKSKEEQQKIGNLLDKYKMTQKWLTKLVPNLKVSELNRITYQQILNDYAATHEKQTTMDFHHQLKGAILDAVDEGLIERDPTRKAIIKGRTPSEHKKIKYLNQFELHTLISSLSLTSEITWDWFILLVAKTGLRFSEALALTPKDFDFAHQSISVNKTWNYKGNGGFMPTKNKSSVRTIQIDWQMVIQFSELIKGLPEDKPIFVKGKVYNSTVNGILYRYCKKSNIPVISIHGLRHTHASILLFAGVSIASVARRLGHSSMNTTQKTYLHIIQELENKDIDLVMRSLSVLN